MGFTPLQTTDTNKGFTPLAASDDLSEDSALPVKKGFTPVTQADATLPQGESDPVNKNNNLIPLVDNSPVAPAAFNKIFVPPALPDALPDAPLPVVGPQSSNFLSQFFPSANANIPVANLLEQDLSPADIERLSGVSSRDRNTNQLINDLNNGVFGLTTGELNALPELIESGSFEDTGKLVAALSEMVPPEALEAVNDAALVNELVNREAPTVIPEGASKAFAEGLFKGLTLNSVETGISEDEIVRQDVQGNDEIARLLKAGDKASDIKSEQRAEEHPVAAFSGEAVGSTVPFIQGVNLLRAARVARGLVPVVNTPAGIVAEGAKVGGPLAFAFKPEDADKMSASEEIAARSIQGGIGLVLGGALDFAGAKTAQALAPFMTKFFTRLKDKKLNAELEAEAKTKGFDSADEYVASATDITIDDSGRAMIRIKPEIADGLPGDNVNVSAADDVASVVPDAPEPRIKTPADKRVQAQEFERLARATDDAAIRHELLRRAEVLSAEADELGKVKLSPKERFEQRRIIDPEADDLITAIRKLGGIDTDLESDVRGRLVHLPRSGFGLPAIERPGVGRNLDDLAESLTELGYLRERDINELLDLLSQAEDGTKIYSLARRDFDIGRGEEPPDFGDTDWRWVDVDDASRSDSDFVIDTDSGTVVPSRPIDENDLIRIQEEEANATGFFEKDTGPTEQAGGLPDTGTVRTEERLPDSVEGRAGDKPGAEQGTGGLVDETSDIILHHSSPHDFDKFSSEHIGTGEGIQAFGRGLYFAEDELIGGKGGHYWKKFGGDDGALAYTVRIPAKLVSNFLDFDAPLSNQPVIKAIPKALRSELDDILDLHNQPQLDDLTGRELYSLLKIFAREEPLPNTTGDGSNIPEEVSEYLNSLDIKGIKYFDSGSRNITDRFQVQGGIQPLAFNDKGKALDHIKKNGGELSETGRSRNFVVFDDKIISIVKKQGTDIDLANKQASNDKFDQEAFLQKDSLPAQARADTSRPIPDTTQSTNISQGQRVSQVETGSLNSSIDKVNAAADVAHLTAPIRKNAQEGMFSVITDGDGNVLRVLKVSLGDNVSTPANVGTIAASINNVDGAKRAWLVHNHPDGTAKQSPDDVAITEALNDVLDGSGVTSEGMVVVAPGGKFTHRKHDGQGEVVEPATIKPGVRDKKVPVSERKFKRSAPPESAHTFDTDSVRAAFDEFGGDKEGILLLNSQRQPVGFVPMTRAEMKALRDGEGGASARLLKAMDESNASGFDARINVDDTVELEQVARNLKGFENKTGFAFGDALSKNGVSAERSGLIDRNNNRSTFYANPFGIAIRDTVRDIGLHPGQNAAAAFAGGVGGATTSEHDAGSAGWWVDVAQGAAISTGASQLLRRTNLLGKGSIVDNWMSRAGDWIESLPLIGRGPAELREAKRKQRLMQQLLNKQTEDVGRFLAKNFTPDERAMMADLIENRGIVKDMNIIHRQAQALDDYLTHAAERMKKLGMLDESLETGGYLHRYYAKHLGLDKLFKEAKGQTLSGSYTIARGTDDVFEREFLSPRAAQKLDAIDNLKKQIEKLGGKKADLVDADTAGRINELQQRVNALRKVELVEYVGEQNGKVRSFMFLSDEVARVDTGKAPVLAQIADTEPGLDPRLGPVAPGVDKLSPTDRVWTLKGSNGKKALLHRDWTKAERQSWGEINDAGYRYVRGMAEVSHDLSLATLYDTIARRSDWVSDEPVLSGKWIQAPDTKVSQKSPLRKYGKLAGKYVRKDVWNGIRNYGRASFAPGPVGKVYRGLLNKWKLYKTVYNPVTHMNNVYSNLEMTYMAGYTPADIGNGLSHLVKNEKSKLWREARDNGLFGTDWSTSLIQQNEGGGSQVLDDIAEQLRTQTNATDAEFSAGKLMEFKEWWINSKNAVADADGPYKTGLELSRAVAAPIIKGLKFAKKPIDAAGRSAQRLYRTEDELFKMAVYAAERKKGTSPEKAVEAAQQFFFDYNDLPEAMKIVRDFPIGAPFISYTYFAVPAIAKNIVQNPEKVIALVAGYEALNYWALTADGVEPGEYWPVENAEEVVSPEWDRGRSIWGAKNTVNLPYVDGYRLAMGRAHALGNPFMTEAGGRDKLPAVPYLANFWGSSFFGGNPLHSILDVVVNEDWKGKNIYEPGDPKEDKAKKIAAYLYQAWTPSNPLVPGSFHQTRIIEGLSNDVRKARQAGEDPGLIAPMVDGANGFAEALGLQGFTGLNRAGNEILTRDAVLGSFGIKLRPIRIDQSVDFESSKINRGKSKIGKALAKQARLNAEGRITDKQFERSERLADRDFEKLEKKEDKLFDAEKFLKGRGRVK